MTKPHEEPRDRNTDLSEAARAVVRDPGDPRIDAHLAAMGLGPDPAPPPRVEPPTGPADAGTSAELAALRQELEGLAAALATARRMVRWLTAALVATLLGAGVVILLLLGRPG